MRFVVTHKAYTGERKGNMTLTAVPEHVVVYDHAEGMSAYDRAVFNVMQLYGLVECSTQRAVFMIDRGEATCCDR